MPFKRPAPVTHASSGQSSASGSLSDNPSPLKRQKSSKKQKIFPDTKVYIVQAKLDSPTIAQLFILAEKHCERLCQHVDEADVVITAIGMRKRLERHIQWDVAKTKAIVTPAWLLDSIKAGHPLHYEGYVAIQDLHDETVQHCPECKAEPCECRPRNLTGMGNSTAASPTTLVRVTTAGSSDVVEVHSHTSRAEEEASSPLIPAFLLPPPAPIPTNASKLSYKSRYSCQRASPLVCPNQALALELDIIRRSRALEGEERSALSYARAIGAVKAFPHRITSRKQVEDIPYLGTKVLSLIEEYLDTGRISESHSISKSPRFSALSIFSSVYGIGPNTARRLYALGLRTLADLEVYYGVDPPGVQDESELVEIEKPTEQELFTPRDGGDGKKTGGRKNDETELGESWIQVALGLREDLGLKVPRDEVEEMGRVVMNELDQIEPGCVSTIVGGYRRGKSESNDVDIVFTHPDESKVKDLCKRLVKRLYEKGMVSHVMHLSGFHGHNPLRTTHWDSLEKALTVFTLPTSSPYHRGNGIRRRLDLIVAQPQIYWCAVVGWSGSIMFQRDLRQWAKEKCGMKFDSSGITRRFDSKQFYPKTEKEVFDLFGLEWVDSTLRNADV